jgi:cytochrome c-type biogenesis protein
LTASFGAIFAAGVLTVLSPCVLPLAPILVGGLAATENASRWARLRATAWFAVGFAVAFVLLGLGVSSVVALAPSVRPWLLGAGAAAVALYGLKMAGALRGFAWMHRSVVPSASRAPSAGPLRAIALGVAFGLTWTPCAGPILGGVLTYVASDGAGAVSSASMLLAYAGGVATPLLLVAAATEWVTPLFRRLGPHLAAVERFYGVALVALGVLVLVQLPTGAPRNDRTTVPVVGEVDRGGVERLLFFHSEHCPTCRAMETFLPAIVRACGSDRWALTTIDVDRIENARIVAGANVRAVPTVTVRDERGNEVARLVGYRSEAQLREVVERDLGAECAAPEAAPEPPLVDGAACQVHERC